MKEDSKALLHSNHRLGNNGSKRYRCTTQRADSETDDCNLATAESSWALPLYSCESQNAQNAAERCGVLHATALTCPWVCPGVNKDRSLSKRRKNQLCHSGMEMEATCQGAPGITPHFQFFAGHGHRSPQREHFNTMRSAD